MAVWQWGGWSNGMRGAVAESCTGGEGLVVWWHKQAAEVVQAMWVVQCKGVALVQMV